MKSDSHPLIHWTKVSGAADGHRASTRSGRRTPILWWSASSPRRATVELISNRDSCVDAYLEIEVPTSPLVLTHAPSDAERLPSCIAAISERLAAATSPAILVDADADRFGVAPDLMALAERIQAPIAVTIAAKPVIEETFAHYDAARIQPHRQTVKNQRCENWRRRPDLNRGWRSCRQGRYWLCC
jgi:Thiamine pyrophosphate enzyme, central domain